MQLQTLAPILFVDKIEPCLDFWTKLLACELEAEVPGDDGLVFVIVKAGDVRIMYQTRASLADDLPMLNPKDQDTSSCLYINVDNLSEIEAALKDIPRVLPRRKTFYGAHEIAVREPSGNLVIFCEFEH